MVLGGGTLSFRSIWLPKNRVVQDESSNFWTLSPRFSNTYGLKAAKLKFASQILRYSVTLHPSAGWNKGTLAFEDGSFTWVVHPCLNDVIQGKSAGGLFVPKAWVHLQRQHLRHVVVVLAEVWILLLSGEVHLQLIVSVTERHGCVYLVQIFGNKDALKVNSNPIQVQGQSQPLSCINSDVTALKRIF